MRASLTAIARRLSFVREIEGPNRGAFVELCGLMFLALLVSALCGSSASQAETRRSLPTFGLESEVFSGELVSICTVRLAGVVADEILASQGVRAMADGFKLRWVHARSVLTQVVDIESFGNWADNVLVNDSVGISVSGSTVAFLADWADPVPAFVRSLNGLSEVFPSQDAIRHD